MGLEGREFMQGLLDDQADLEAELGQPVRFEFGDTTAGSDKVAGTMVIDFKPKEVDDKEAEQMAWVRCAVCGLPECEIASVPDLRSRECEAAHLPCEVGGTTLRGR